MIKKPFKVGDLVTSHFYSDEQYIVRRITKVWKAPHVETGWSASADEGEPCSVCGKQGTPIGNISAWWFKLVEQKP